MSRTGPGPQAGGLAGVTPSPARRHDRSADASLLRRAADGDLEAFTALYRRHSGWVFRVAAAMCGDQGDAEDITQDVFVQVWQAASGFRGDSGVTTWIRRICVNRCIRTGRRRHAMPTALVDDVVSDLPDPAAAAVLTEEVADLNRALRQLPEPQRVALVLRELGQLSYEEVADVLDISLTAARSRIHRGRLDVVRQLAPPATTRSQEAAG